MEHDDFLLPEGAELVSKDEDTFKIAVEMPIDDDGFFGRQCPSCSQIYRLWHEDYRKLKAESVLHCVYCGQRGEPNDFMTEQQLERLTRPVGDMAMQMIADAFGSALGNRPSRPARPGLISISVTYRSEPFFPDPLPEISEERMIRERVCERCSVRYAVFGDHRFCPLCGKLAPLVIARDALAADIARLDALSELPDASRRILRERGVFDRTFVDVVKNLVTIVETLARDIFESEVSGAAAILKGLGNVFQRLDDLNALFVTHLGRDPRSNLTPQQDASIVAAWAARHLYIHRDGVVDDKYLASVPGATAAVGHRLTLEESVVREAVDCTSVFCGSIATTTDVHD